MSVPQRHTSRQGLGRLSDQQPYSRPRGPASGPLTRPRTPRSERIPRPAPLGTAYRQPLPGCLGNPDSAQRPTGDGMPCDGETEFSTRVGPPQPTGHPLITSHPEPPPPGHEHSGGWPATTSRAGPTRNSAARSVGSRGDAGREPIAPIAGCTMTTSYGDPFTKLRPPQRRRVARTRRSRPQQPARRLLGYRRGRLPLLRRPRHGA